jgi:hypothetical protein
MSIAPIPQMAVTSLGLMFQPTIVKQVSWFKSSLLLRIQIKYTNELQFLNKTKSSILIGKCIQQIRRENQAWLGLG